MYTLRKTNTAIGLIFIMMALMVASSAAQSSQNMRIKTIIGDAEVRSKSGKWRPARVNMPLKEGWDIRTYVESSVEIQFSAGVVIRIGEKSAINLSKATQDGKATKSHVKIYTGKVWGNVQKLVGKSSSFDFETPTAVASIRGTRLGISVDKNGTSVDVYEGAVSVRKKGSTQEVLVETEKRAVVQKDKQVVSVMTFKQAMEQEQAEEIVDPFQVLVNDSITIDTTMADTAPVDSSVSDTAYLDTLSTDTAQTKNTAADSSKLNENMKTGVDTTDDNTEENRSGRVVDSLDHQEDNGSTQLDSSEKMESSERDGFEGTDDVNQPRLRLILNTPSDGQVIEEPLIRISGVSSPGATIYVGNKSVRVNQGGIFAHEIPIPDEEGEFSFDVIARLDGQEREVNRTILYQPQRRPLRLSIQSPVDGQVWENAAITVTGRTTPKAAVVVNGRPAVVTAAGTFSSHLRLLESDLGKEYSIEVRASDGYDEIDETIYVTLDNKKKQLNTSVPSITVAGVARQASRNGQITVQVTDRTPDDQIRLVVENDGSMEEYLLEPNGYENVRLEEGKNELTIVAYDQAQNRSNTIHGEYYYLPGPLDIIVQQPFENPLIIDDLPPMPHSVGAMRKDIEVEIDDGIGTVPETIQYVRIAGSEQEILMNHINRYTYRGTVNLIRGRNLYTIIVEDVAGNRATEQVEITISD